MKYGVKSNPLTTGNTTCYIDHPLFLFFFFKQKTAYEISRDWSSDVCSSDLHCRHAPADGRELGREGFPGPGRQVGHHQRGYHVGAHPAQDERREEDEHERHQRQRRSEERRVGKECRSRWST